MVDQILTMHGPLKPEHRRKAVSPARVRHLEVRIHRLLHQNAVGSDRVAVKRLKVDWTANALDILRTILAAPLMKYLDWCRAAKPTRSPGQLVDQFRNCRRDHRTFLPFASDKWLH